MAKKLADLTGTKNCEVAFDGKRLTMEVDLTKTFGESSSGKTIIVAGCNAGLGGSGVKMNFNCYHKLDKAFNKSGLTLFDAPAVNEKMNNVEMDIDGHTLRVTVKLSVEGEEKGDKTFLASTTGNRALGKSNITVGLNCYYPTAKGKDLSKLAVGQPGWENITVLPADACKKDEIVLEIDTGAEGTAKPGKGHQVACSGGHAVVSGHSGYTVNLAVMKASKGDKVPTVTSRAAANEKAQGVEYTHSDGKLRFYLDKTGDYGETGSGLSVTVANTRGRVDGLGNLTAMVGLYKKTGKKAERKPAEASKDDTRKRAREEGGSTLSYAKVKKIVKAYLDKTDGDISLKKAVEYVRRKTGSEQDNLKAEVKRAVVEIQEEEEEDEESGDEEEDDSAPPPAKKSKK
eukprot:Rhum_TRINITY_DN14303_c20_g1::Rhum_TRINITY_DN14303_c20_g1_i1::g.80074::m.80074